MSKAKRDVPAERLRKFVEAYMANPNGAAACRAAGYRGDTKKLSEQARRLLKRADVKRMMEARVVADPAVLDREARQKWWSGVIRGEVKFAQVTMTGDVVEVAASVGARLKASELLARAQGDFVERHEHRVTGKVEVFTVQLPQRDAMPEPDG